MKVNFSFTLKEPKKEESLLYVRCRWKSNLVKLSMRQSIVTKVWDIEKQICITSKEKYAESLNRQSDKINMFLSKLSSNLTSYFESSDFDYYQGEDGYLESIGDEAFMNCESLREIVLPLSLQQLGTDVFTNCERLESVIFNCNLTELSDGLFVRCRALSNINIPEGITRIGKFCFSQCEGLKFVDLPSSVTLLDDHAFYYCRHLKGVACRADNPPTLGERVFYGTDASLIESKARRAEGLEAVDSESGLTLFVPSGSIALYKAAPVWQDFKAIQDVTAYEDYVIAGVEDVQGMNNAGRQAPRKVLQNGRIYIKSGEKTFHVDGTRAE